VRNAQRNNRRRGVRGKMPLKVGEEGVCIAKIFSNLEKTDQKKNHNKKKKKKKNNPHLNWEEKERKGKWWGAPMHAKTSDFSDQT